MRIERGFSGQSPLGVLEIRRRRSRRRCALMLTPLQKSHRAQCHLGRGSSGPARCRRPIGQQKTTSSGCGSDRSPPARAEARHDPACAVEDSKTKGGGGTRRRGCDKMKTERERGTRSEREERGEGEGEGGVKGEGDGERRCLRTVAQSSECALQKGRAEQGRYMLILYDATMRTSLCFS